jgi:hypothetical protein
MTPPTVIDHTAARRAAARRTALIVACLALTVYVGFMLLNVVGK